MRVFTRRAARAQGAGTGRGAEGRAQGWLVFVLI